MICPIAPYGQSLYVLAGESLNALACPALLSPELEGDAGKKSDGGQTVGFFIWMGKANGIKP